MAVSADVKKRSLTRNEPNFTSLFASLFQKQQLAIALVKVVFKIEASMPLHSMTIAQLHAHQDLLKQKHDLMREIHALMTADGEI